MVTSRFADCPNFLNLLGGRHLIGGQRLRMGFPAA
jgi:hypothetical protein